jgi:hypothetical protein
VRCACVKIGGRLTLPHLYLKKNPSILQDVHSTWIEINVSPYPLKSGWYVVSLCHCQDIVHLVQSGINIKYFVWYQQHNWIKTADMFLYVCILYSKQKLLVRQITNAYMTRIVLDYILSTHAFTSVRTEVSSMQQVHCRWAYVLTFQHKICISITTFFFILAQNGVLRMDNTL